eukprot:1042753-Pyramimonas_sp.AAC.1
MPERRAETRKQQTHPNGYRGSFATATLRTPTLAQAACRIGHSLRGDATLATAPAHHPGPGLDDPRCGS